MKKSKLNFLIDGIMFLLMGLSTGIGLLIKYVLLSGEDSWIKYGQNVDISFWGLDRHEWGRIHLIVAIILIVFVFLHLIFHWKMIICLCKSLILGKTVRIILVLAFVVITIILVVFPFLIQTEVDDLNPGKEHFHVYSKTKSEEISSFVENDKKIENPVVATVEEKHKAEHHNIDLSIEVKGFMTIQEVSDKYKISCNKIKEELNIPKSTLNSSKLGHLRKQYNFKMSDLELVIAKFKKLMCYEKIYKNWNYYL